MLEIKQKPFIIDLFATTRDEFREKSEELVSQGWIACNNYEEIANIYKQTFVEKDNPGLKYITDYLFEVELSNAFDLDIVNKMFDRWSEEAPLLTTQNSGNGLGLFHFKGEI